jgi:hypothetical protein
VTAFNTQGTDAPLGRGGEISVHDLYEATLNRGDNIQALKKEIAEGKKQGHRDSGAELNSSGSRLKRDN